jgi:hypothetical protein
MRSRAIGLSAPVGFATKPDRAGPHGTVQCVGIAPNHVLTPQDVLALTREWQGPGTKTAEALPFPFASSPQTRYLSR